MGLGHGKPSSDVSAGANARVQLSHIAQTASIEQVQELLQYAFEHGIGFEEQWDQTLPVRILTPAGEVALEQQLPGSRTVRSVLQTLSDGRPGRLLLLHGTQVVPQSRKLSELNLTEESSLYVVRKPTGTYTPWSDEGDTQHHLAKCLLVGGAGAGKTSWIRAYSREGFEDAYTPTIGVDFKILRLQSEDGARLKIQLWDTAGQPRFRTITNGYFRGASGLMLFFSLRNRESLNEALQMFEDAERGHLESCRHICMVATHADITDPEVTEAEAEQLARQKGWLFFAVSNKAEAGIDDPLFAWLDLFLDGLAAQTS